ncbi:MAG: tetratricopeptide repeat protein [Gemmatimonadota bacterium]|nr:tetratricopeptide repeat protein [Gemmatimonadota bacterium]
MKARTGIGLVFALWMGPLTATAVTAQSQDIAREALRTGAYDEAVEAFTRALRADPSDVAARLGLMESLMATGRYERAIEVGRDGSDPEATANHLGEALLRVGRRGAAEEAFARAADAGGRWSLTAEANLAEVLFRRGAVDDAMERFDRFIDVYNASSGRLGAPDLVAVGRAVTYLGRKRPDLFQDALRAFDEATDAEPGWHAARVRAGDLFLEKYSSPEAKVEYQAVLATNPNHTGALFGMARALEFDRDASAGGYLERLLEVNPNHVEARALRARRHLTRGDWDAARAEVDRALEVNPSSLSALTALAGIHFVTGDDAAFAETRRRVLELNPRHAGMDATLADLAVQTRRYSDAVARARAAVELDSASWEAWGLLGLNRLRTGRIAEGREALERAFEGDPYNPWFKNTLDLLDTFDRFDIHETPRFELFLHGDEADLLATYLAPLAEEAYTALAERYGVEPEPPVRAEFYPSHADFSVRTLGEAGLGALGVSFGPVLVMDAPSARTRGDYNWASVFWHELAHTFHLAMTDHRVPRWFSEGLAVHEQRKARPGWGHRPTLSFLSALRDGRLKPVSELNDGFMRPDYPEQVVHSYYQASLVFEWIEERHGFQAIRSMLEGYRHEEDPEALFESVLGTPLEAFDETFETYLEERFARPLAGLPDRAERPGTGATTSELEDFVERRPNDFAARLSLGARLIEAGRLEEAEGHLREAAEIFPEYAGPNAPHLQLARLYREQGDLERAVESLARHDALAEASYETRLERGELLAELGRPAEAADALAEAVLIWPYELDLHRELADRYAELGDHDAEVLERRAVVALDPTDRARAYYRLARAETDAGRTEEARRSVLRALEIAPNYEEALELLLELRGRAGGNR